MSIGVLLFIFAVASAAQQLDPAAKQLPDFKKTTHGPREVLTTGSGAFVDYRDTNLLNSNLLNSEYYMDEIQSSVRERIPERTVHASGIGAFGYFEVTNNVSHFCKAKLFSKVGKRTPIAIRLSVTPGRSGIPDTNRGSRGFALKFYTEEGNFDLTGFNIPLFSFKNPALVIALFRILKNNPVNNLPDPNMRWDFTTQNPEAIFPTLYTSSDYAAPASYSDMTGHPVHTYQMYNEKGESSYWKWHIIPCTGAKYLNATEAQKVAIGDPNFYARGFYNAIAKGQYPCYHLKAQILTEHDRKNADMDIFDVTKLLDERRYPLVEIGKIIVNKNCQNHFAEIETLAFSPGNYVPGMLGAPDKIFEARRFTYRDNQMYRLGSNFKKIPVNCPMQSPVHNYIRDGVQPTDGNGKNGPNYYPNSFNGPAPVVEKNRPELLKIIEQPPNNFEQAGHFYSNVLTADQKTTVINNLVNGLCLCTKEIKKRAIKYFKIINADLSKRVTKGLAANCP